MWTLAVDPWIDPLLRGTGVVGAILVMAAFGWIYFKPSVEDLRKAVTRLEVQDDDQRRFLRDVTMPAIVSGQEAAEKTAKALSELEAEIRRLGDVTGRLAEEIRVLGRRRAAP